MSNQIENKSEQLSRGLSNRHIQLLALGGAIGTGLFLGVGPAAVLAGPSVILGYAVAGFFAFLIMRQLGEMLVDEAVSGSFSYFAFKYWGDFAGFASGWNYWLLYILVSMSELTAIGIYIHFWWPEIPVWASGLFFFLIVNALNLTSVKIYGETEFWFAIIKVTAIVLMIIFGCYLLISGTDSQAGISNLWKDGGFFPNGLLTKNETGNYTGLFSAIALIMFSFGGLELVGIAAAEAKNPEKNIKKAVNQLIYRILIFYIGSLIILFSLTPWHTIDSSSSPFVAVFDRLNSFQFSLFGQQIYGSSLIANGLNIIVLSAALSVYNSGVYSTSRMLHGLAIQGNAHSFLKKLNKNKVPVNGILFSALFTAIGIIVSKMIPENAFEVLISIVVSAMIISWFMICYTHIQFKKANKNKVSKFKTILYPWTDYLTLAFLFFIGFMMWKTGFKLSIELIPIWIILLYIGFRLKGKERKNHHTN